MRKILLLSAIGLLGLGSEMIGMRLPSIAGAHAFTYHDVQAPLTAERSDTRDIQAPRAPLGPDVGTVHRLGDDEIQAPVRGDDWQSPLRDVDIQLL